jgi:hypothetical protein
MASTLYLGAADVDLRAVVQHLQLPEAAVVIATDRDTAYAERVRAAQRQ